jgi:hypothetical protein
MTWYYPQCNRVAPIHLGRIEITDSNLDMFLAGLAGNRLLCEHYSMIFACVQGGW